MKIKAIDFRLENLQLSKPYKIAWKTVDHVENLFCKITLDNGVTGYGACNPENEVVHVSTAKTLLAKEKLDYDLLIGKNIEDPGAILEPLSQALPDVPTLLACLDLAVYDAWAKNQNKSLVNALGKKIEPLSTSVTIGIMDVEETLKEANAFIDSGFDHLKIKIGIDLKEDIDRLKALRDHHGSKIFIRADVNQGYILDEFKKLYVACQDLNIELYEQPLRADRFEDVDQLAEEMRRSIAADESLHDEAMASELAANKRCGIFNIKLMKCGGLYQAGKIIRIAEPNHIDIMWGCNDESNLSIAAAMHLAYSTRATKYLDLDGSFDLAYDLAKGGFEVKDGKLLPLDKPGIGVELEW